MKIKTKLYLIGIVVFIGFSTITLITLTSIKKVQKINELILLSKDVMSEFIRSSSLAKDLVITGDLEGSYYDWSNENRDFAELFEELTESILFKSFFINSENLIYINSLELYWETMQKNISDTEMEISNLISKHKDNTSFITGIMMGYSEYQDYDFISTSSKINILISMNNHIYEMLDEMNKSLLDMATKEIQTLYNFVIITATIIVIIILLFFIIFSTRLIRRFYDIRESMRILQNKDFTIEMDVKKKDELGAMSLAINVFIKNFSSIINGVKSIASESADITAKVLDESTESAVSINEVSTNISSITGQISDFVNHLEVSNRKVKEIANGITSLSERNQGQSLYISQSTTAVEQMNSSIISVADISHKRKKATDNLVIITKNGGEVIEMTLNSVQSIVQELGRITEIVELINNIASQTNLLAMNASIEAAHAGHAGKGFSVVANEIRKLADATNNNSQNISEVINGTIKKMNNVLKLCIKSKNAFTIIEDEVDSTNIAMTEISNAMNELSYGSTEIMDSMIELTGIAKKLDTETEEMQQHTNQVFEGINKIEEVSLMLKNGMVEIEIGAHDINNAIGKVNTLQLRSGESVKNVLREVSNFKTKT